MYSDFKGSFPHVNCAHKPRTWVSVMCQEWFSFFCVLMSEFSDHLFFPRPEFISKFTKLKDRWQSAAQRVRQRKSDLDGLVGQWRYFTTTAEDLLHFLNDTCHLLSALKGQDCHSLHQTRRLIRELKVVHAQSWCEDLQGGRCLENVPSTSGFQLWFTCTLCMWEDQSRHRDPLQPCPQPGGVRNPIFSIHPEIVRLSWAVGGGMG